MTSIAVRPVSKYQAEVLVVIGQLISEKQKAAVTNDNNPHRISVATESVASIPEPGIAPSVLVREPVASADT